ncbi:pilus assembly protein [Thiorhodococcus minor]|uniref:PilY1 beta-propeller domain-containing protein n=1 Tax=Thiorhodococcus minor TaxID=57489 RepID=A0A6M0K6Q6_9GAMM|nr:PilC/PilY family type IV pilus protein [Thiorhodococcus minor]NEV65011.1 hypothetical protein [Thiorhodococcus minor]
MNGKQFLLTAFVAIALVMVQVSAAAPTSNYKAIPTFLVTNAPPPNVLLVLDTSNSMDENIQGEAVGSDDPTSRSEIARNAIKSMISAYSAQMRFGLMGYRQTDVQSQHIHNAFYYISHDPGSYDAGEPSYFTPQDQSTNTRSYEVLPGKTVYYDQALPYYAGSDHGTRFCYSTKFQPRPDPTPPVADINVNISQDNNYTCCTSKTGIRDISPDGSNNGSDPAAIAEYGGSCFTSGFNLTDSDVAAGFWQIGAQLAWNHAGTACLSKSTPGGGKLHTAIADSTTGHIESLNAKLGTWSGACNTETPLRNAGFTPLASTLASAKQYFEGDLPSENGGPAATPIQYSCHRSFVVLVTDGLPTEDLDADGDFIDDTVAAAASLRNISVTPSVSGAETSCDVQTFVLGFALPDGMNGALDPIAAAGGTDVDGSAYYAGSEADLLSKLNSLFLEILNRSSSGTASTLNLSSANGEGVAVRATFQPKMTDGVNEVRWTGQLNALFVDDAGNLREDNGTAHELEDAGVDHYVDMCFDAGLGIVRVRRSAGSAGDPRPTQAQKNACSGTVFPDTLSDISYVWDGGRWLADIPEADIPAQRSYSGTGAGRHILTMIDTASGLTDFVASTFTDSNAGLLLAADAAEAETIVNFVRGNDQAFRSRQIDVPGDGTPSLKTWRLGDIVYSSPTVMGRPAEEFDLLYKDASYGAFLNAYRDRRQVAYVGGNDGMLHAFNSGYYDASSNTLLKGASGATQYDLGAELWSYVPYNLLPHLKYLTRSDYGVSADDHVYYVDLTPRLFDAQVFGTGGLTGQSGVTHTNGWGTILVVGMRFGGGEIDVDVDPTDPGSDERTMRSAYAIFDVTDPEQPPALLAEFSHPELGYTLAMPAPIKTKNDNWYLMLGSGPYPTDPVALNAGSSSQNAKLFLLNLKTMSLEPSFGTNGIMNLLDANAFVSDLIAVDYNLDYGADAVYFGTVSGSTGNWSGKLQRIRIVSNESTNPWTYASPDSWSVSTLYNTNQPITATPSIALDALDNRWVFVGTGRFLADGDTSDTTTPFYFYGIKEPRDTSGAFTWGTASTLVDVTGASVYERTRVVSGVTGSMTSGSPCGTGSIDHFEELECYLRQYSFAADYKDGWRKTLSASTSTFRAERNIGQATLLGGALTFTGYMPSSEMCEAEGKSNLHALFFGTGTGYPEPIIGLTSTTDGDGNHSVETVIDLGVGLTITPSLHTGRGYDDEEGDMTAVVQTSTGTTVEIEQKSPLKTLSSGEIGWREHSDF